MPNVGCMLGMAYQILASSLAVALKEAGLDVTVPEYLILRALYTKDDLQQCEIADMVGKDKGAVSRSVAVMAHKELVRTEPVSYKCTRVRLTPRGRDIEKKIMEVAKIRHDALSTLITADEMESFVKVLKIIISIQNKKG